MWSSPQQLTRRLARAIDRHGVLGTLRIGVRATFYPFSIGYSEHLARRERRRLEREFDRKFGVSTGGKIPLSALEINSGNVIHGNRYASTRQDRFNHMLSLLQIDYRDFVFIDFGSGKGKALLLASEFPFQKVIGVEFSHELHEVAQENIRRYRSNTQKCHDVQSVCMDAAAFPIPEQPLVCFLFNPFGPEVMSRVLASLRRSLEAHPRDLFILYQNPTLASMMDEADFLVRMESGDFYVLYRNRPIAPALQSDSRPIP